MAVHVTEFEKALLALQRALAEPETDLVRDATIQRFEFCVELAWKTAKKQMGSSTPAPKQIIREMAQAGLIDDVSFWLLSIDQRNLSAHTYNEDLSKEIYAFARKFLPIALKLLGNLKA